MPSLPFFLTVFSFFFFFGLIFILQVGCGLASERAEGKSYFKVCLLTILYQFDFVLLTEYFVLASERAEGHLTSKSAHLRFCTSLVWYCLPKILYCSLKIVYCSLKILYCLPKILYCCSLKILYWAARKYLEIICPFLFLRSGGPEKLVGCASLCFINQIVFTL